ncbi:hypothetical protein NP233_g3631 [Leucocoprinus birnbaumii]|uniref:F-box domain-containing protein n=1 Tax=Leucocoprinus birnbaumii TaxID=56174 RepID=A0AAD5VWU2_9AGAR|nr:hypothetical protein NP233_g3631 [Leucocoprinus birnbaumii]
MTSLRSLPYEILQKVFQNLSEESRNWLRDWRLVSRTFNDLIVPILFAKEIHGPSLSQLSRCLAITSDLKAGVTDVFSSTKHLAVTVDASDDTYLQSFVELWKLMLPKMSNIRSLHWGYLPADCHPDHWVDTFVRDIGTRSTLTDLKLGIAAAPPYSGFSLEPLSNLTTVEIRWSINYDALNGDSDAERRWQGRSTEFISQVSALLERCPTLQSFAFSADYNPHRRALTSITLASLLDRLRTLSTPSRKLRRLVTKEVIVHVDDIRSNLHHLHHLEELVLEADPNPSAFTHFGDICATLQRNDIKIKNLLVGNLQHSGVSQYIASYQGLEKLIVRKLDRTDDSPVVIGGFITSLQNHSKTLKWLEFDVDRLSPWPQGIVAHLQSQAEQYVALQTLRIRLCVTLDDTNTVECQILVRHAMLRFDERLQMFTVMQTELLETAMRLQALCVLECPSIRYKTGSGELEDYIELRRGVNNPSRIYTFMKGIVERFKRAHEPKFVIKLFQN